jgi:Mg2+ and Co2+ transporter CorA
MEASSREAEAIQDQIFIARDDDMTPLMLRIYNIRKRINHLTHSLSGKSDVLNGFVKRCRNRGWHPALPEGDLLVYLSDIQDHLVTILAELAHLDEITSRLQSNFLAQMSVNNMRLSVRLNSGLSKVTVLATIFVPLHMVTGLFGMNVTVPGQDVESLAWFLGIVGVFCTIILAACFTAVRLKLL